MSNTAAMMGMNLGEARRREARAKERRERNQVSPETRAARAGIIEAREAALAEQQAALKAERDATPDALRAVFCRGSIDELASIARMISRLDGRRLQALVDEIFREKSRAGYVQASDSAAQARSSRKATTAA